jgi:integrase
MMKSQGSVYSWCGCRDRRTGRRLGSRCPRRGRPGHGSWYVSVELPAGPGGDRRRIRRGGFPDHAAAEAALASLVRPAPWGPADHLMTVGQWLAHWLEGRAAPRFSTLRGYGSHVRQYLQPCLGQILLADLRTAHVQAMFTTIARQRAAQGRPVSAATLARIKATLRAALNAAIRAGYLTDNPACRTELPSGRRPRPVVWTAARVREWERTGVRPTVAVWLPAQTAWFLNSIQGDRLYAAYHLIALRGLRRGEAAGLRWCDVDLDDGTAMICQQLQQYSGHLSICPPKTAGSERAVALDRTTVAVLRRHRAAQESERSALGDGYHHSGYVFTGINGDPMAPDRLSRHFRQLSAEAGLPPVRLHDLRHCAASLALAAGAELKTIQDQLGHSSIVLTADTYISVLPEVARKAAEDTATLVIKAGYLVPGTRRPRHAAFRSLRQRSRAAIISGASLAHPARQIGHPAATNPPVPAARRPAA